MQTASRFLKWPKLDAIGQKEFNEFIRSVFARFVPSPAHVSILNLPWDCVYTTNYDTLLEKAHAATICSCHKRLQPVFSNKTSVMLLDDGVLPYYKLHGCIDYANTDEGRLVITLEDYRYYETHRRKLFQRLERDLVSRCLVFVGYGLKDTNFLSTLQDACDALEVRALPRSYVIRKSFTSAEKEYWRERYNIELLDCSGSEFIALLESTWAGQQRAVLTPSNDTTSP